MRKGIVVYLVVTFGTMLIALGVLLAFGNPGTGTSWFVALVAWGAPALAAFIASRVDTETGRPAWRVWPIPKAPAVAAALGIPAVFALIHGLCVLAGWADPHWTAQTLVALTGRSLLNTSTSLVAILWIVIALLAGPTLYAALWLGGEVGWRGYLLPRLLPCGRWPAYLATGLLWGAFLLPYRMIYFWGQPGLAATLLGSVVLSVAIAVVLGEVWRRWRHVGLTAVCFGVFAAQTEILWPILFPRSTAPYGGSFGLVAIIVWAAVALVLVLWPSREPSTGPVPGLEADSD